jgi:hypothetical protein
VITLSPDRQLELVRALSDAFKPEALQRQVLDPMQVPREHRIASRDYLVSLMELVRWADSENRIEELLRIALEANRRSEPLQLFAEATGILPPSERLVDAIRPVLPRGGERRWLSGLREVSEQVCVVARKERFVGTGFLVGPNRVMTHRALLGRNLGEVQSAIEQGDVYARFGAGPDDQQSYQAVDRPLLLSDIDVILIKLDGEAGRDFAYGTNTHSSRGRGWIVPQEPQDSSAVVVVQHVPDGHLAVSIDPTGMMADSGDKIRYRTSTREASMGAPCFDAHWRLLGMHVGATPRHGNEGIAIEAITRRLEDRGYKWDVAGGVSRRGDWMHAAAPKPAVPKNAPPAPRKATIDERIRGFKYQKDEHDPADDVWSDDGAYGDSDPDRWAWAEAAAVTAYFDPEKLVLPKRADTRARDAILLESSPLDGGARPRWVLGEKVRVRALERLAHRGKLRQARSRNPGDPSNPLDAALGDLIDGRTPSRAELQDPECLRARMQAAGWLANTGLDLPDMVELRAQLERATMLAPFRHLTRGFFAGREEELSTLRQYVEAPDGTHERPIFIHGPGGMGKSALLAHFILANSERDTTRPDAWNPFIYLDFDRPELDASDLGGVMIAIARQVGPQSPLARAKAEEFREKWMQERRDVRTDPQMGRKSRRATLEKAQARGNVTGMIQELAELLKGLTKPARPVVLVVDTLEEAQYSTPDAIVPLVQLMRDLNATAPNLRPILAGRAELSPKAEVDSIPLRPLPDSAAQGLLGNHLPPELAAKSALVARMVQIVGGNPLSLRLAAEALRHESSDELDAMGEAQLWERVGDAVVQGQLYERIVGHLHEGPVKKIAVPGLVLRYVTADLIRDVLAKPCELDLTKDADATQLFAELSREIALVRQGGDGAHLVLRKELRRTVLDAFRRDAVSTPKRIAIHEAAVRYFRDLPGIANRAEEIYHRLWLDQDPKEIDKRWIKGVEVPLREAVEEMPGRAHIYLSNRVGGVDESAMQASAQEEWEPYIEKRASAFIALGSPEQAVQALRGRVTRLPNSRLHLVESVALRSLSPSDLDAAAEAAELAVQAARVGGSPEDIDDALRELVQVRRMKGDSAGVLRALADLGQLGEQLGDDLVLLQSEVEGLEAIGSFDDSASRFSEPAVRVFSRLPDELIASAPELARRMAAQAGGNNPEVLQRVVRLVGVGALSPNTSASLGRLLSDWAARDSGVAAFVPKTTSPAELTSAAQYLLTNRTPDAATADDLSRWMQTVVASNRNYVEL